MIAPGTDPRRTAARDCLGWALADFGLALRYLHAGRFEWARTELDLADGWATRAGRWLAP